MDSYLGLRLKLSFKDGSSATGTVSSLNDQKLSLIDVKLIPKGAKEGVSFPELTVFASNIDDVEIISSNKTNAAKTPGNDKPVKTASAKPVKAKGPATNPNATGHSPHATPSVYANQTHTFPSGNARKTLPQEEFDFAANLARFDKANEFKKIQAEDLVPKGDRLVAINSPQRKLGIKESVLDKNTSSSSSPSVNTVNNNINNTKSVNDEIMEKFKHLTVQSKSTSKSSPLLVEEGTSSEDERDNSEQEEVNSHDSGNNNNHATACMIPMINGKDYEQFCSTNLDVTEFSRTISAINFAHHLLAELDQSKVIVLLLGVGEASAILMETFYHLMNHSRLKTSEVIAIFAAGGVGSGGKRIELSSAVKQARKKLLTQNRVKFTTSLNEIVKIQGNVVVFDALGHDGEVTNNAEKGLTEWMKKLTKKSEKYSIYGIESSLLRKQQQQQDQNTVQLVTFGIARDTISASLKVSNSILYVDSGIPKEIYSQVFGIESDEIFSESFVVEIEY